MVSSFTFAWKLQNGHDNNSGIFKSVLIACSMSVIKSTGNMPFKVKRVKFPSHSGYKHRNLLWRNKFCGEIDMEELQEKH